MPKRIDLAAVDLRFWKFVDVQFKPGTPDPDFSKCWPWKGGKGTGGGKKGNYGKFWFDGKHHKAHRIAFMLHYKRRIPYHLDGAHQCDNPPCCNPTHIRPASHRNNVLDWWFKKRARGPMPRPTSFLPLTDAEPIAQRCDVA